MGGLKLIAVGGGRDEAVRIHINWTRRAFALHCQESSRRMI
jgi:hypothetical protein